MKSDPMDILYDFCYYVTLFLAPLAIYSLLFKNSLPKGSYKDKDWFYVVKLLFAKSAVQNFQKKCKLTLDETSKKILENPKEIFSKNYADSQFIYGHDQRDNSLSLRFTIKSELVAEVFLCLRLSCGTTYTFPEGKTTRLYRLANWQWKTKDLFLEILEPFKRIRISYNGLLSNANHDIEHVHFKFIWTCAGAPQFYPQDVATGLLTEALAQETWKDGNWIELLGDERGYDQFGALHGFVRSTSFQDDLLLNLPSCRTRFWGTSENKSLDRSLHLFVAGKDGTLINLWVKSLKNGCKGLKYGSIIMNNGETLPIDYTDLNLEYLGNYGNLPDMFIIHVGAKRNVFRTVLHLNLKKALKASLIPCEQNKSLFDLANVPAECDLNAQQGKSIINFWYAHEEPSYQELPPPIITEKKLETWPTRYTTRFSDEESKISRLCGGKGCSLAQLSSLKSKNFIVPDGFIVTVNAFNRQLDLNFNMKKAVAILDDICCGRTNGDLEQACEKTVQLIRNEEILQEIKKDILKAFQNLKEKVATVPDRWAVRSSAVGEDSEELSAAGQNETFLGCSSPDDVLKSVSACWASLFTYQSVKYRHQHGLPVASDMAVVVQQMVPADCAGVLFTCHPSTSNPAQIVITANYGLGESVVSGKSEPDTVILARTFDNDLTIASKSAGLKYTMIRMTDKGVEEQKGLEGFSITDHQALDLGRVGVFLEETFGSARDIEWAYYQGQLFLLQSRPVTTIHLWSESELLHEFDFAALSDDMVYTVANIGEVLPGAIPVLSLTTSVTIIERALQKSINYKIDPYAFKCMTSFQHHMFIDVIGSIHKNVNETISLTSKIVDLAIFGHPIINETIHSLAIARFGVLTKRQNIKNLIEMLYLAWNNEHYLNKAKKLANCNFQIDIDRDNIKDMYKKIDSCFETGIEAVKQHCMTTRTSVSYQVIAMSVLVENNEDFNVDHYNDVAMLLSSCDEVVSAEIPAILDKIADVIRENDQIKQFENIDPKLGQAWLESNCTKASKIFTQFLQDHGHRALGEFDITKKTWAMDPGEVIKMIQANCKKTGSQQHKKNNSIEAVIKNLKTPQRGATRKILKFLMKKSRRAVGVREQTKSEIIKFCDKLRIAYKQLAHKMALSGLIPNEELIFHLTHYEVEKIIEGLDTNNTRNSGIISKALRRQKLYSKWDKLKFPEISYGNPQPESRDYIARIGDAKVKCEGTPVCAGVVQARACVIRDLAEINQLQDGDILITYCTDIGWSPYFPMLAGIVTELGGLVSHGAVIAREYGLPSIVGAKGATRMFKTGDIILLSGKSGILELVE